MQIVKIRLKGINSFIDTDVLELSPTINVLVGQNNAGKSTLLNTILILQHQELANLRVNHSANMGSVEIVFKDYTYPKYTKKSNKNILPVIHMTLQKGEKGLLEKHHRDFDNVNNAIINNISGQYIDIDATEPNNVIYPFTAKRKVSQYQETVNITTTNAVTGNLSNLYPKIARLCDRYEPGHELYNRVTEEIFGYPISTVDTEGGKKAAYRLPNNRHVPLTGMGEGVSNILGLIVNLCRAENNIFIIEELENDIHPKALKSLLKLIIEKSKNNQFFISTHSNVVLKELGADLHTKIFQVSMSINNETKVPNSTIKDIGKSKTARVAVLEDLGYEFQDFELWHGWLFLEESSAERVIREYFVKWYTPKLIGRLKTFSAKSKDEVKPKFDNFNSLFVFLHLEPTYKNKAWVVIDAGEDEKKIIEKMKDYYVNGNGWDDNKFRQWGKQNFEEYYPGLFKSEEAIKKVLKIQDKQQKRAAKKELLDSLVIWIEGDEENAKKEFEASAKEVIDILREIEGEIT